MEVKPSPNGKLELYISRSFVVWGRTRRETKAACVCVCVAMMPGVHTVCVSSEERTVFLSLSSCEKKVFVHKLTNTSSNLHRLATQLQLLVTYVKLLRILSKWCGGGRVGGKQN